MGFFFYESHFPACNGLPDDLPLFIDEDKGGGASNGGEERGEAVVGQKLGEAWWQIFRYSFGLCKAFGRAVLLHIAHHEGVEDAAAQQAARARRAKELQDRLEELQDEMDALEKEMAALPLLDYTGKTVHTKLFGDVVIDSQEENYLSFTTDGKQVQYALPGCIVYGFLIEEDPAVVERCRKEVELLHSLKKLNSEQRIVNMELSKY